MLVLSTFLSTLLLTRAVLGEEAAKSKYCKLTSTQTYRDNFGPLFVENRYVCDFPAAAGLATTASERTWGPIRLPAPWSHPAGSTSSDPRVHSRGTLIPAHTDFAFSLRDAQQKTHIVSYGCESLPHARRLPADKFSNLFWGIGQLPNQTCIAPGEVVEFVDYESPWAADWRFTNVNRGNELMCDWYTELANVGRALHYFCFHTLGRREDEEFTGGVEIVAFGRDADKRRGQRWCVRYSEKGWGEGIFDERCLGV